MERFGNLGNARDWAGNWRSHGGYVTAKPALHDVACFQPNVDGADAVFGHVGVVVAISGVLFTVSEMNGPAGPGRTDDRVCRLASGVSFLRESAPLPPVPPITPGGSEDMLYQDSGDTVWLVTGGVKVALGDPNDVKVFLGIGWKMVTHVQLTALTQSRLAKLPEIT